MDFDHLLASQQVIKFYNSTIVYFSYFLILAYHLEYVTEMSPPAAVPAAADRVYSVAVNSITSRPLKAVVKDASNNDITTGDFFDVLQYEVETLDVNAVGDPNYVDTWINSGGHLVMWGRQAPIPGRLQRKFFT